MSELKERLNMKVQNTVDKNLIPDFINNNIFRNSNVEDITYNELINRLQKQFCIDKLKKAYNYLYDEYSKNMFLSSIIQRVSNYNGLFLILYYSNCWKYYYELVENKTDYILNNDEKLYLFDIKDTQLKKDIKLYYSKRQLFETYFLEQYRFRNIVCIKENDYIIDGGACYGDTAFYI